MFYDGAAGSEPLHLLDRGLNGGLGRSGGSRASMVFGLMPNDLGHCFATQR